MDVPVVLDFLAKMLSLKRMNSFRARKRG